MLIRLLVLNLVFLSSNAIAQKNPKMTLPKILSNGDVILGDTVKIEIKKHNPDFKVLNRSSFSKRAIGISDNHPMAVTADFNSDGYRDIALYGFVKKTKELIIYVAISDIKKNKYEIKEAYKTRSSSENILNLTSYLTQSKLKVKSKSREVFLLENYEPGFMSSTTYYYSFKNKSVLPYLDKLD